MFELVYNNEVLCRSDEPFQLIRSERYGRDIWKSGPMEYAGNIYAAQQWSGDPEECPVEHFFTGNPEPAPQKVLSVIEFKMCFTSAERVEIYALQDAGDAVVTDWLSILDDPRCTGVDLGLENTRSGVEYLVDKITGFTTDRAAAVLNGEMI